MSSKITFFRVGNGDMTLISFEDGTKMLMDCNITADADNPENERTDVAAQLKSRLNRDSKGRLFVDVMVLSHPDADHCTGLERHFHLGLLDDYDENDEKIVINEMWSSPIVFRRASKNHTLCSDAKAWAKEARRRVNFYKDNNYQNASEKILVIGEDIDGKTDDILAIVAKRGSDINSINGKKPFGFNTHVIGPFDSYDDEESEKLSKNDSSIILRIKIGGGYDSDSCRFLAGGDAEVYIWEKVFDTYKDDLDKISYDLLLSPHHCSWHSLSNDSWGDKKASGEVAKVSDNALSALNNARKGAIIVASSKSIKDDDSDPPCIGAKNEYQKIVKSVDGAFYCVNEASADPFEIEVTNGGISIIQKEEKKKSLNSAIGVSPVGHG